MDIEYYRNFIAIVDAGSISAAAKKISIAQPALSNQLKLLQKKYNTKLINVKRGGHSLELTDAGKILYQTAQNICKAEASAVKEVINCSAGYQGTLKVSLSPSMSISFIRNYLCEFSRIYPQINFELHEVTISDLTAKLLEGRAEIAVANAPLQNANRFETIYTRKENLVVLFNVNSPFLSGAGSSILLEDLQDIPVCLSRGCSDLFVAACNDSKLTPKILSINSTKTATITWAVENVGVAVVPAASEEIFSDNLICKIIQDDRLYIDKTISIVKGRPLSPVAKLFLNFFSK